VNVHQAPPSASVMPLVFTARTCHSWRVRAGSDETVTDVASTLLHEASQAPFTLLSRQYS
jgi:hypothetical protein